MVCTSHFQKEINNASPSRIFNTLLLNERNSGCGSIDHDLTVVSEQAGVINTNPYYLITEEDICTIRDYILGAFYEGESKERIYNLIKAEFSVIRSHPYNPQAERKKVLDELVSMLIESCSENYEPNGMGCKCCPFLIVYDDGLQCAVKELRQEGKDGK